MQKAFDSLLRPETIAHLKQGALKVIRSPKFKLTCGALGVAMFAMWISGNGFLVWESKKEILPETGDLWFSERREINCSYWAVTEVVTKTYTYHDEREWKNDRCPRWLKIR